jgi:hypothetical protein
VPLNRIPKAFSDLVKDDIGGDGLKKNDLSGDWRFLLFVTNGVLRTGDGRKIIDF